MRKFSLLLVLALVFGVFALPAFAQEEPTQTIAEIVVAATEGAEPQFTILLAAVGAADPAFLETLSDAEARVTVFAPTDEAFGAAFEALDVTAEDVLADANLLNTILAYHVVPSSWTAESLLAITAEEATPIIGTFLPEQALVLSQSMDGLMVNESTVIAADIMATNGTVHVIDSVLVPDLEAAMAMMDMEMEEPTLSIAELVVASTEAETPEFTTLLAAVAAADPLVLEELTNGGPYTVFAPTDEAFAATLEALGMTAEDVLADQALLTSILAYHVIPGTFSAETIIAATGEEGFSTATLLGGTTLSVMLDGESVMVNDATVVAADIYATNGVIHVIDSVLLPPM
jgi:uncharacterized surface protein with fasciclin (FAS1) repeats